MEVSEGNLVDLPILKRTQYITLAFTLGRVNEQAIHEITPNGYRTDESSRGVAKLKPLNGAMRQPTGNIHNLVQKRQTHMGLPDASIKIVSSNYWAETSSILKISGA